MENLKTTLEDNDYKEIKEQIELYKKLQENAIEFANLKQKIKNNHTVETKWRNVKFSYWKDICLKYDEKKLLNCYGDIFFIDEKCECYYVGRRVLWNLELSKEQYYIDEIIDFDVDGNYNYTEYEISVKTE